MRRLLLLVLLAVPSLLSAAVLEGRVVSGDEPLAGVVVSAYTTLDFTTAPVARSVMSDSDGMFALELPLGTYALFGWNADRSRFAFCGRNPVNVTAETVWAGLQSVPVDTLEVSAGDDDYSAAIEGRVLHNHQPVVGANVYLYLDVAEDLKGQGYRLSLPTAKDGYFRFDGLPESNYFLVARHRRNGQRVGPVLEGDQLGIYPGNPLTARAGQVHHVTLHTVAKLTDSGESETSGSKGQGCGCLGPGRRRCPCFCLRRPGHRPSETCRNVCPDFRRWSFRGQSAEAGNLLCRCPRGLRRFSRAG
jgi:hypothetical protein